ILKAKSGSPHCYDVVDPNRLNPALGTEDEFQRLIEATAANELGWVQDVVPNHMAFDSDNQMLMDVLESGPQSSYFGFFDIDWDHGYENIRGRLLAPFLGRFYGECLEDGEIALSYGPEGLSVRYGDLSFPASIRSYPTFFSYGVNDLKKRVGAEHPDFVKLLGILYVLQTLDPSGDRTDWQDQVKFVKRILWELYSQSHEFRAHLDRNIEAFNGQKGKPESFSLFDELLSQQFFQLSFWKVATKEINYRRFFNINGLISVRTEDEEVLDQTHALILGLLRQGAFSGLRIDHVDGLFDPTTYLERLRNRAPDAYIVVEKILDVGEELPETWPVQGSTGYDFLNDLNGLFCEVSHERALSRTYSTFTGSSARLRDLVISKKMLIIQEHMAGEVNNLAQELKTISSRDRHGSDITMYGLRRAIAELLSAFPVYRTYINSDAPSDNDRRYIAEAVDRAMNRGPALMPELNFIRRFLLLQFPPYMEEEQKREWVAFVMRFQQFTGPLMAKGYEDTALYVYNRLISLNEVGGSADRFGMKVQDFHRIAERRQNQWPGSLNTTSTHDTKRGEDVRARINVLSEIPAEWDKKVRHWGKINRPKKRRVRELGVPDRNDEYFLYQTLLGAFPNDSREYPQFVERLKDYIIKVVREAKVHTKWIQPDAPYEEAYLAFVDAVLDRSVPNEFLEDFLPFQRKIAHYGVLNSLSQVLIKITAPGVPDFYQGSELWDFNLVDPDNRRPVDFRTRHSMLRDIVQRSRGTLQALIRDLLASPQDGRIKLFVIHRALQARKRFRETFQQGTYIPLATTGDFRRHLIAFARRADQGWALVIAPRFLCALVEEGRYPFGEEVWRDTEVILPTDMPAEWLNAFTDQVFLAGNSLRVGSALDRFPVGLFVSHSDES
ncbi:MAG: malto-oligosyltrehalose synthase, partial [Thermodesulfobacteriota bacterium]